MTQPLVVEALFYHGASERTPVRYNFRPVFIQGAVLAVAIVTGSSGLVGSACVRHVAAQGMDVVGVDNDMRRYFFGDDASTAPNAEQLCRDVRQYRHVQADVRDRDAMSALCAEYGDRVELVIHTAAQPSHDWAAREPLTDFSINAEATLVTLEALRQHCPDATYVFCSTNKVYGDTPNRLPLVEQESRWEPEPTHPYAEHGIDESMSVDASMHSIFGASKLAADVMTQEYGRYFGLKTGVFRCGCITGPAHAGAPLHGFLAYLVRCAMTGDRYSILGYKGKQVRDNIHADDLASAFWHFHQEPKSGEVYNMGGSRFASCSILEAIELVEQLSGKTLAHEYVDQARAGDHIWWISDVRRFQRDYSQWAYQHDLKSMVEQIIEANR